MHSLVLNAIQDNLQCEAAQVPEDPFVLYNFVDLARVTTIVITVILLQNLEVHNVCIQQ